MIRGEQVFPASMSPWNALITYGVGWGVFLGVPLALGILFAVAFQDPEVLLIPLPFLVIQGLIQGVRTRGFGLSADGLRIHRLLRPTRIALSDIAAVRSSPEPPPMTVHLWALRGFYGAHGRFWNNRHGTFRAYVTDERHLIELATRDGRHVFISPDDPPAFVARLAALLREQGLDATLD